MGLLGVAEGCAQGWDLEYGYPWSDKMWIIQAFPVVSVLNATSNNHNR